jgi:hypothetical protein
MIFDDGAWRMLIGRFSRCMLRVAGIAIKEMSAWVPYAHYRSSI